MKRFSLENYEVCSYCMNVGLYDDDLYACTLALDREGRYKIADPGSGLPDEINSYMGCEKFKHSGLPMHPLIKDILIKRNPLVKDVTADSKAKEVSCKFVHKVRNYTKNRFDVQRKILTVLPT